MEELVFFICALDLNSAHSFLGNWNPLFKCKQEDNSYQKGEKIWGEVSLETRQMKNLKSSLQIVSKKFKSSAQVNLTYSICWKHDLDATVLLQASESCITVPIS